MKKNSITVTTNGFKITASLEFEPLVRDLTPGEYELVRSKFVVAVMIALAKAAEIPVEIKTSNVVQLRG